MRKPISPRAHGVLDFATAGAAAVLSQARNFFLGARGADRHRHGSHRLGTQPGGAAALIQENRS
jgi:hypothetical protein